jgi:hypothetical protein
MIQAIWLNIASNNKPEFKEWIHQHWNARFPGKHGWTCTKPNCNIIAFAEMLLEWTKRVEKHSATYDSTKQKFEKALRHVKFDSLLRNKYQLSEEDVQRKMQQYDVDASGGSIEDEYDEHGNLRRRPHNNPHAGFNSNGSTNPYLVLISKRST